MTDKPDSTEPGGFDGPDNIDNADRLDGADHIENAAPAEPVPPIQSRFLFVDVAALRAKQLRRGARVRFDLEQPHKLERVAMEEVRRGLVHYDVPVRQPGGSEGQA